jgi:hypothetical protein
MVAGHYAMSLLAYERHRGGPLWLFLFAGIFLDILMISLVLAGVEEMAPAHGATRPGFATMAIDMTYSHDLLPVVGWAVVIAAFAFAITRSRGVALWAGALVLLHEVADMVSGFTHYVFGPDTHEPGAALTAAGCRGHDLYVLRRCQSTSASRGRASSVFFALLVDSSSKQ